MPAVRVLFLNPFSQHVSGPDETLLATLEVLIPRGLEAHVVLPAPGPLVSRYQQLGATIHYAPLSILRRRVSPWEIASLGARVTRGTLAVMSIARAVRADVIDTNMEVVLDGGIAARLLDLPHVLHYRGNTLDEPKLVFDGLTAIWAGLSDRIFCISNLTAQIFRRRGRGAKVTALYDPVDIHGFARAERSADVRQQLGAANELEQLVGTVARIHPRKDLVTFIEACALLAPQLPNARFVIVGDAHAPEERAYERTLRALVARRGLTDRFCFAGARSDMPEVFKALDVFVLSSRHEGFGRVVPEALAAGKPVVISREGALTELIEEGREGFFATSEEPAEFAHHIARLLQDDPLRSRLGTAAVARARLFDATLLSGKVMDEYLALTDSTSRAVA